MTPGLQSIIISLRSDRLSLTASGSFDDGAPHRGLAKMTMSEACTQWLESEGRFMALFSGRRKGTFSEGDNKGQLITASFNALSKIQRSLTSNLEALAKHL